MRLETAYRGAKKTIYWLHLDDESDNCPASDYLLELKRNNAISHQAMVRRYSNHADIGSTRIKQHGHPIKSRSNLFVWKTNQGARLLYFNIQGNGVVVTHGYYKGDPEKQQYNYAETQRDEWLRQRRGRA